MKINSLLASLLVLIGLSSLPVVTKAANLLQNGGFNPQGFPYPNDFNLILGPWQWSGSLGYTWANNSQLVSLGPGVTLDAGGWVGFGGSGLIYQDFVTTPGQTYELTITAHSRGTASRTWLQPLWQGNALSPGLAKPWEWTAISYDEVATATSTRITIMAAPNNDGPIWVDSVSVTAVPEPSVGGMAAAGIAALALGMHRQRQDRASVADRKPLARRGCSHR